MSSDPNRRWYHCVLTTYGAWLPGDPRGFRTRHHREHVEGDYKHPPPPGTYDARHQRSEQLQRFPAVTLATAERALLGRECVRQCQTGGIEVIALAVAGQHVHLQFQCDPQQVIATLGKLKRAMWYARRQAGNESRLWGRGRKIVPIRSREHQERVFRYILAHRREGAWVWCYRDGFDLD